MPPGSDQEKTERATPKRRREARERGQVAQSRELPSAIVLLLALGVFFFAGSWTLKGLTAFMRGIFEQLDTLELAAAGDAGSLMAAVFRENVILLLPLMGAVAVGGVLANVAQVGVLLTGKPLEPKWSRLNPVQGLRKLFSLRALVELLKALIKVVCVGGAAYWLLAAELANIPALTGMDIGDIFTFAGTVAFRLLCSGCVVILMLAALDYAFQRWQHEKDMRMTKQEVKEESKQSEGDPLVRSRIRSIQMETSRRRMMEEVPQATVVVTNPTRLAVALRFDPDKMLAPKVVAKGAGLIAGRIRQLAREHDIPLVEDKPLAQTLFKAVEIGHYIPAELYRAVAEVLAYVYRLQGRRPRPQ